MSSDDKIEELVYKASLRKNFWADIKKLRIAHSIPMDGYLNESENTGWYVKRGGMFAEYILDLDINVIKPVILFDDALISFLEK